MTQPIENNELPTTPQQWIDRAKQHYAEARRLLDQYRREQADPEVTLAVFVDTYRMSAAEAQHGILAADIASAIANEFLCAPISAQPYSFGDER